MADKNAKYSIMKHTCSGCGTNVSVTIADVYDHWGACDECFLSYHVSILNNQLIVTQQPWHKREGGAYDVHEKGKVKT